MHYPDAPDDDKDDVIYCASPGWWLWTDIDVPGNRANVPSASVLLYDVLRLAIVADCTIN